MATNVPASSHQDWCALLHDFVSAHPAFADVPSEVLQICLAPAASVARWLANEHPELLKRPALTILLPGASLAETRDGGAWFAFLPWLLGNQDLKVKVILVGLPKSDVTAFGDQGVPARFRRTGLAQLKEYPKAKIFRGSVGQWRQANPKTRVDACVLFSPGLAIHYETWLAPGEILPHLSEKPLGVFGYSKLDALEDQEVLKRLGFRFTARDLPRNPWHWVRDEIESYGSFAYHAWSLENVVAPEGCVDFESPALREWLDLHEYLGFEIMTGGIDQVLWPLGTAIPMKDGDDGRVLDEVYLLPYDTGVLKSTGLVGTLEDGSYEPLDPPVHIAAEDLADKPDDSQVMDRINWAIRLHRDVIAPLLGEDEDWNEDSDEVLDDEQEAGNDWVTQIRLSLGLHGPTHPCWYDLLANLGWDPQEYVDEPVRLEPAFYVTGQKHAPRGLPVICEAYCYLPDDEQDALAIEAMARVKMVHAREGALLVFKCLPYKTIDGKQYSFGGMLLWESKWYPFALNQHMTSVDDVIEQALSEFSFEEGNPRYADNAELAVPFNQMCHGRDPNEPISMIGMKMGDWVLLMPAS